MTMLINIYCKNRSNRSTKGKQATVLRRDCFAIARNWKGFNLLPPGEGWGGAYLPPGAQCSLKYCV
ncbi:hypothetical protein GCM10011425_38170 [Mucilaginibacter galii]|uniref:Uncharacterized protein n=1 Tax=Mucilaginibacter galii TaxID=2005073 RepID=A0A917JDT5_9SPHI|nr:hypothetical protein GCM10011425_38170 [Mucilaginibacter galii]